MEIGFRFHIQIGATDVASSGLEFFVAATIFRNCSHIMLIYTLSRDTQVLMKLQ